MDDPPAPLAPGLQKPSKPGRRMIAAGVLLGLVGLVYTLSCWSMPVLYTPICNDHYHDREVCIAILTRMRWSLLAPLPGLALAIAGVVRRRRSA